MNYDGLFHIVFFYDDEMHYRAAANTDEVLRELCKFMEDDIGEEEGYNEESIRWAKEMLASEDCCIFQGRLLKFRLEMVQQPIYKLSPTT